MCSVLKPYNLKTGGAVPGVSISTDSFINKGKSKRGDSAFITVYKGYYLGVTTFFGTIEPRMPWKGP